MFTNVLPLAHQSHEAVGHNLSIHTMYINLKNKNTLMVNPPIFNHVATAR